MAPPPLSTAVSNFTLGSLLPDLTAVTTNGVRQHEWLFRLAGNLLAYATVVVPFFVLRAVLVRSAGVKARIERSRSYAGGLLRLLFLGNPAGSPQTAATADGPEAASKQALGDTAALVGCAAGLLSAYLTWGLLQEKIMTRPYEFAGSVADLHRFESRYGVGGVERAGLTYHKFSDSQFLVFMNRLSAFVTAGVYILLTLKRQPAHTAGLYKYSYASLSNILSSWCQYEALKFITFPAQVLGKACKIVPVMLMGKLVARKSYPWHQYGTALLLSAGVSVFLLSRQHAKVSAGHALADYAPWSDQLSLTNLSGVLLLVGYLACDAFTSNWQGDLFRSHRMSSVQMMCGVNAFSAVLTFVALLEHGTLAASVNFLLMHSGVTVDALMLSLCSALGQLVIFYTINRFGPVTFTIIMTLRHAASIFLSCLVYGHPLGPMAVFGLALTFVALFLRIHLNQRCKPEPANRALN